MPIVSILTVAFNHEAYIGACIRSVLAQDSDDWELIVVDDGSTDGTWAVVDELARGESRIKAIRQSNQGPARLHETYNTALAHSAGSLIAILEGDDLWPRDKLSLQVPIHGDRVLMSYGRCLLLTETATIGAPVPPFSGRVPTREFLRHLLLHESHMIAVTQVISREALVAIGGFHQDGSPAAVDMATLLRLCNLDGDVVFVDEVLGLWRQHDAQSTSRVGIELAEHNLTLALTAVANMNEDARRHLGVDAAMITNARRSQLADVYFATLRRMLRAGNRSGDVPGLIRNVWRFGGVKRKLQAAYAYVFAPFGITFEPVLRWFERR